MGTPRSKRASAAALALCAFVLTLLGQGFTAGPADAHAWYLRSNPGADARLQRAPTEVRVTFSEPPDLRGSEIQVLAGDGRRVDLADLRSGSEPNSLVVGLREIGDGGYTVAWTVLSTVDGHTTRGSFVFSVGDAALPAIPDVGPAVAPPTPLEISGRALSFTGIALAIGIGVFGIVVGPLVPLASRRRETQLVLLAAAMLVIGPVLLWLDRGADLPARLALLYAVRAAAGIALFGALAAGRFRHEGIAALGVVAATTATLTSHAARSGSVLEVAIDLLHVLFIGVWFGGLATLAWSALPFTRPTDEAGSRQLGRAIWRFSLLAIVSVAVIVITGTIQSTRRLVLPQDLVETPYGIMLAIKIAVLVLVLGFGALNLLRHGPRLRRAADPLRARRGLVRGTIVETLLIAVALGATGALTALPPPARASDAAYDRTQHVDGLRVQLLLPSTQPGRNRFVVRVRDGLRPVAGAEKVALRFTMVEHDMGENELVAEERAPGEYVAEGGPIAMFGTWRVEAIVRRADRDEIRTTFSVPISGGTGPSAARVLNAGPFTLVAFPDPVAVVAGAPFTLSVVVVDAAGAPVPGRTVVVTPSGPGTAPPVNATEASPGRYVAAFRGLEVGAWQLVISLEGSSAAYALDVTP